MKILGIIPARGGSKGLPKKNIKLLGGKPLIAWSIDSAKESELISTLIVNSDCDEIIEIAKKFNVEIPFKRPDSLAIDTASTKDVIIHTLDFYRKKNIEFDYVVLLQPTTPFRKKGDIDLAIKLALSSNAEMVVSVKETAANPYYVLFEENNLGFLKKSKEGNFTRRQDCPKVYEYNGSIYVIKVASLLKNNSMTFSTTLKFEMSDLFSIDIDNEFDFQFAEFLLNKNLLNSD